MIIFYGYTTFRWISCDFYRLKLMNDHDYQWDDIAEAVIWHRNNLIKLV